MPRGVDRPPCHKEPWTVDDAAVDCLLQIDIGVHAALSTEITKGCKTVEESGLARKRCAQGAVRD